MAHQTLWEIRRLFVQHSGRNDLVTDNGADNGADEFIKRGQDYLDENVNFPKELSRHVFQLAAGGYSVELDRCISVAQVWAMGGTLDYYAQLTERTLQYMRSQYGQDVADMDQGTPTDFAINVIGLDPSQYNKVVADFSGYDDIDGIKYGDHFDTMGLLIFPPADATYTLNVFGHFYSKELTADTDVSYWTVNKPLVLVKAACMLLEASNRNSEGLRDWKAALDLDLMGVDKTAAEMDIVGTNEMNG